MRQHDGGEEGHPDFAQEKARLPLSYPKLRLGPFPLTARAG